MSGPLEGVGRHHVDSVPRDLYDAALAEAAKHKADTIGLLEHLRSVCDTKLAELRPRKKRRQASVTEVAAGSDIRMAVAAAEAVDHVKAGSEITAAAPTAARGGGRGVLKPSAAVPPAAGGDGACQPQPLRPVGSLKGAPACVQQCFFTTDDGLGCECLHLQLHANGAHSEVYIGVPLFKPQHIIVKAAIPCGVEALQNEAKVLAHLGQHPNICSLLGTGQSMWHGTMQPPLCYCRHSKVS